MQRFNVHRLLRNNEKEPAFLNNLDVKEEEIDLLKRCRKKVRRSLRSGFEHIRAGVKKRNEGLSSEIKQLQPRFMTQGSFEYKTLNNPAINPPQQIDLDDGVYFPMALVNGKPQAAKTTLLNLVREILFDLAEREGWELTIKSTCLRLEVNSRIHIDVPVYAIPERRHVLMTEALESEGRASLSFSFNDAIIALNPEEVHLARWDEDDWIVSDPKQLHDWFVSKVQMHGRSIRPLCRYIKSWRDLLWEKGGPTSITLMAAVVQLYDKHLAEFKREFSSDCEALLYVTSHLPAVFSSPIMNPVNGESELYPSGLQQTDIDDIQRRVSELDSRIHSALCESQNENDVIQQLKEVFGERIPNEPSWVSHIKVHERVKSIPLVNPPVSDSFPETHRSA